MGNVFTQRKNILNDGHSSVKLKEAVHVAAASYVITHS